MEEVLGVERYHPLADEVLIRCIKAVERVGSLLVPVGDEVIKRNVGIVEAVGPHRVITVKKGDVVIYEERLGRRFTLGGVFSADKEYYTLISFYSILAVVEDLVLSALEVRS